MIICSFSLVELDICGISWNQLFRVSDEAWVSPESIISLLQMQVLGFGKGGDAALLWQCGVFVILWCLWTERNSRILEIRDQWDRATFMASLLDFS